MNKKEDERREEEEAKIKGEGKGRRRRRKKNAMLGRWRKIKRRMERGGEEG